MSTWVGCRDTAMLCPYDRLYLTNTGLTLRCGRKPYSCVAVIHELPQMHVMFCVSPEIIKTAII